MPAFVHNLYIEQGASFLKTFAFRWLVELSCPASGTMQNPVVEIEIDPLPVEIPSGYNLNFGCNRNLVTAAATLPGSNAISVVPWIGSLRLPAQADGPEIDYSSQSFSGVIKRSLGGETLVSLIVVGSLGLISLSLSKTQSALLPSNIRREQLPSNEHPEIYLQDPGDLLSRGFVYQVYQMDPNGAIRNRALEGRVFVSGEV